MVRTYLLLSDAHVTWNEPIIHYIYIVYRLQRNKKND